MNASADVRFRTHSPLPTVAQRPADTDASTDAVWEGCVDCPHCGGPVAHPGFSRDGETAMAECARCDVLFQVWGGAGRDTGRAF